MLDFSIRVRGRRLSSRHKGALMQQATPASYRYAICKLFCAKKSWCDSERRRCLPKPYMQISYARVILDSRESDNKKCARKAKGGSNVRLYPWRQGVSWRAVWRPLRTPYAAACRFPCGGAGRSRRWLELGSAERRRGSESERDLAGQP